MNKSRKGKKECCLNCKFNIYDCLVEDWSCNNPESDNFTCPTFPDLKCDDYEYLGEDEDE